MNRNPPNKPERVAELTEQLHDHNWRYYVDQHPAITDHEYDLLFQELKGLEAQHPNLTDPNSPTQRVAGTPMVDFDQIKHSPPMLSLANASDQEELNAWHQRVATLIRDPHFPMVVELKIDGLANRITYEAGLLALAGTRGNGVTGEDVTPNVRTIRNLPLSLKARPPERLVISGEVYLPWDAFERINQERATTGDYQYSNPRNAAAGTVRQLDPRIAADRDLRFWAYTVNETSEQQPTSHWECLNLLLQYGFPVNPLRRYCTTIRQVLHFYHEMLETRHDWNYEADGIVIKVDDIANQLRLGATEHEPRWATAYKFPSERGTTKLIAIETSVGRFGQITPVAVLEAISLGGVTIQNASLHNEEDIRRKDIRAGDQVTIERAGYVIPQVIGPVESAEHFRLPIFTMPSSCPACSHPAVKAEHEAVHRCLNRSCPAQALETLKHFVGKEAMDIEGLGEQWCQALIDQNLVDNPADIYQLTKHQLLGLNRMGDRLATRILNNIETSRSRPLNNILYGLSIFRLGHEVSRLLSERYPSLDAISELSFSELTSIDGIGPTIAESVVLGFRNDHTKRTIAGLKAGGVTLIKESSTMATTNSQPWVGKNIVVTGTLASMKRAEAESRIRSLGGNPTSSVSRATSFLVCGEKPGSKLTKANALSIPVFDETEFLAMLRQPDFPLAA